MSDKNDVEKQVDPRKEILFRQIGARGCGLNANEKIFRKNLTKITLKSIVRSEKISVIFMKNSSI